MEDKQVVIHLKSYSELLDRIERYEKALKEIEQKGGWLIRGQIANDLAEIARKALRP